jgi:hypothetical protein
LEIEKRHELDIVAFMNALTFPDTIVPVLHRQLVELGTGPLPSPEELMTVLRLAFYASLGRDEGRAARFALALVSPASLSERQAGLWAPMRFERSRPATVDEIVRLAPATDPYQTLIALAVSDSGDFSVVGLVRTNRDYYRMSRGVTGHAENVIARCLQIVVHDVATMTISAQDQDLAMFVRGQLLGKPASVFMENGRVNSRLRANTATAFGSDNGLVYSLYPRVITQLLMRVADKHHGGTIVLCPPNCNPQFDAKYSAKFDDLKEHFIDNAKDARDLRQAESAALASRGDSETLPVSHEERAKLFTKALLSKYLTDSNRLYDAIDCVGDMASIDGAVVLSHDLVVCAFGAMFTLEKNVELDARQMKTADDNEPYTVDLSQYGARHRSAASFCRSHPGAIAFAVSEDGPISCFLKPTEEEPLLLWRPITTSWLIRPPPTIQQISYTPAG